MTKVKITLALLAFIAIGGYANYSSYKGYYHRASGVRYLCTIAKKDTQASPERDEFLKTCEN